MKPYYEDAKTGIVLYCGDCREVLPGLPDASVDLVITDPPFGISQPGVVNGRSPADGTKTYDFFPDDTAEKSLALARQVAAMMDPLLKPHASLYWWLGHRQFSDLTALYETKGWRTRFLVWRKTCACPPPPGAGWPSAAELCLYVWRPGQRWTHNGKDFPESNVLDADSYRYGQPGKVDHPTQKPFSVVAPLIRASSVPGDLVLDPFAGSGTTLIAARDAGCRAVGCEISEAYCEISAKRLEQGVFPFTSPEESIEKRQVLSTPLLFDGMASLTEDHEV